MKIFPNALAKQLNASLVPFYMVLGDEPMLVENSIQAIIAKAKTQGFSEVLRFDLAVSFDWDDLLNEYHAMSLFSEQKVLLLDVGEGKLGQAGGKVLSELSKAPNPDMLLIIKGTKASQDIQRTAWFKALDKQGWFIPCYPLEGQHLARYLNQKAQQLGLTLSPEAMSVLTHATQGNLMAAEQELEKLALTYPNSSISESQASTGLLNQSQFDVFDLSDAMHKGDADKVAQILARLQHTTEPVTLAWLIHKEVSLLLELHHVQNQGAPVAQALPKLGVWKSRSDLVLGALQRIPKAVLEHIYTALDDFDALYKQAQLPNPNLYLSQLALMFCQPIHLGLPKYEAL